MVQEMASGLPEMVLYATSRRKYIVPPQVHRSIDSTHFPALRMGH